MAEKARTKTDDWMDKVQKMTVSDRRQAMALIVMTTESFSNMSEEQYAVWKDRVREGGFNWPVFGPLLDEFYKMSDEERNTLKELISKTWNLSGTKISEIKKGHEISVLV